MESTVVSVFLIFITPTTIITFRLDTLQWGRLLELPLDLLARVILCALAVQAEQSTQVELWCLEHLDLPDVDVL